MLPLGFPPKPNCAGGAGGGASAPPPAGARGPAAASRLAGSPRTNTVAPAAAQIDAVRVAVLRFGIQDGPVRGVVLRVEPVAAPARIPVRVEDAVAAARAAWPAPAAVVLQPAAHEIRLPHIGADRVKLSDRDGVHVLPRLCLVVADVDAAVVADDQVIAVLRIDPDRVMVAVRDALHRAPGLPAVNGFEKRRPPLIGN